MKTIKTLEGLRGVRVTVLHDADWEEYQVRIKGSPDATYHTDALDDALATAEWMRGDAEVNQRRAS